MQICVVNKSTLVPATAFTQMVSAVASQLWYHAAPAWGRTPTLTKAIADETAAPPGSTVVLLMDDSDQAGALGYHSEDEQGRVFGRVFARPSLSHGGTVLGGANSVSATLSHEVLEAFIDPTCMLWSDRGDEKQTVAYEIGDPVEDEGYPVTIQGATTYVSNFVTPAWFDPQAKAGPFDYLGTIKAPLTLSKGGYVVVLGANGQPQNIFGDQREEWRTEAKASNLSRTAKRLQHRKVHHFLYGKD
jgi:hypothetical protein